MTKIKLFQLRLFRTIRRQICSIDMIDIETFVNDTSNYQKKQICTFSWIL